MARKAQINPTDDDKKATAAAETASGPQTPATGNEGAAEAGEATAVATPAEATPPMDRDGWVIEVKGPAKGRWRIGRHFGPEAVLIPAPELTDAQLDALFSDPELTTTPREVD